MQTLKYFSSHLSCLWYRLHVCPLSLPIHGSKQPATYTLTGLREPETLLELFAPSNEATPKCLGSIRDGKTHRLEHVTLAYRLG